MDELEVQKTDDISRRELKVKYNQPPEQLSLRYSKTKSHKPRKTAAGFSSADSNGLGYREFYDGIHADTYFALCGHASSNTYQWVYSKSEAYDVSILKLISGQAQEDEDKTQLPIKDFIEVLRSHEILSELESSYSSMAGERYSVKGIRLTDREIQLATFLLAVGRNSTKGSFSVYSVLQQYLKDLGRKGAKSYEQAFTALLVLMTLKVTTPTKGTFSVIRIFSDGQEQTDPFELAKQFLADGWTYKDHLKPYLQKLRIEFNQTLCHYAGNASFDFKSKKYITNVTNVPKGCSTPEQRLAALLWGFFPYRDRPKPFRFYNLETLAHLVGRIGFGRQKLGELTKLIDRVVAQCPFIREWSLDADGRVVFGYCDILYEAYWPEYCARIKQEERAKEKAAPTTPPKPDAKEEGTGDGESEDELVEDEGQSLTGDAEIPLPDERDIPPETQEPSEADLEWLNELELGDAVNSEELMNTESEAAAPPPPPAPPEVELVGEVAKPTAQVESEPQLSEEEQLDDAKSRLSAKDYSTLVLLRGLPAYKHYPLSRLVGMLQESSRPPPEKPKPPPQASDELDEDLESYLSFKPVDVPVSAFGVKF